MSSPPNSKIFGGKGLSGVVGVAKRIQDWSGMKRRRLSTVLLKQQDSFRKQQIESKEARMLRHSSLLAQHKYILEMVALHLDEETRFVEEGVLDAEIHMQYLDSLLNVGGRQAIVFISNEMEHPPTESGRSLIGAPKQQKIRRVIITDGSLVEIGGDIIIVYRIRNNVSVDSRNISDELFFMPFFMEENDNSVSVMQSILSSLHQPLLHVTTTWGEMNKSVHGIKSKQDFISKFDLFISFLETTKLDLEGSLRFQTPSALWEGVLSTPAEVKESAKNPETVAQVEVMVNIWCKQIEQVLTQSHQLRREKDDVGPTAELEYWRRLLVKFTSIVEHIKSMQCKMFIQCLIQANSKLLKVSSQL
uniref:Dynein heavy chain tail domain-containing protein n=1 Tax=Timema douglasi TaxID=61478 RepID=A0A7R8Z5Q5_TIMDO|nr:unnamed protein product [Timema douglasi]